MSAWRGSGRSLQVALVSVLVAVGSIAAGCGGSGGDSSTSSGASSTSASGGQTVTLGISAPAPGGNMLQLGIAEAQDYFKDQGLTVKPVFLGTSGAVLQALAAGKVQIGMSTPDLVLQAIDKGQNLEMVYNWTTKTVGQFGVLPDSPIRTVADLKGKTIGVQELSAGPAQLAKAAATSAGLNPDTDLKFVAVGTGAPALDALQRHRVDALITYDTLFAAMTSGTGTTLRFIVPAGVQDLFSSSFVASKDWVKENPKAIAGFGNAWARASVFALANPKAGVQIMFDQYPTSKVGKDEAAATTAALAQNDARLTSLYGASHKPPAGQQWGEYPPAAVAHWIQYAKQFKLIESQLNPADVYTNAFVKQDNAFDSAQVVKEARQWQPAT